MAAVEYSKSASGTALPTVTAEIEGAGIPKYIDLNKQQLFLIDDGFLANILISNNSIYEKFSYITSNSLKSAILHIKDTKPQILLINNNLSPDSKSSKSVNNAGIKFIINNPDLQKMTQLIILAAFNTTEIPELNKLASLGVLVVKSEEELVVLFKELINYADSDIAENYTKFKDDFTLSQKLKNEGVSPHITSDIWTTEDALGYEDYAYAIYKFMTHPKTKPPLTISIQAPWGGGKTSLMRMVRKYIDPEADSQIKKAADRPKGELKLREALEEIKKWIDEKTARKPIEEDKIKLESENKSEEVVERPKSRFIDAFQKVTKWIREKISRKPNDEIQQKASNLTVWFNAWKYENTNQVWAGLIDAIMQQVAARLPVKERELFWLRLNLKRVDSEKIRKKIHDRIFNYFLRGVWFWVIGLFITISSGFLIALGENLALFGLGSIGSGISLSAIGTLVLALGKYIHAHLKVNNEPAAVSLSDYLEIPNYSAEFGFIHRAEIDLKNVLESIPRVYKPLVIFVDDLDRCSPTKISQVVEAVNLFLAGDFPQCMFVMGMDTEMVAAALQSAHKDMIANLPDDLGIPIGWRFMDKFVQLPFLIPPCQKNSKDYVDSLFNLNQTDGEEVTEVNQKKILELIQQTINQNHTFDSIESETKNLISKNQITEKDVPHFKRNFQSQLRHKIIDRGISSFTDRNKQIRDLMDEMKAFDYFVGNPRELKRFINAFRFNYFLWWAKRSQGSEVVSEKQLLRWTVLSMKWAEVVRWLRRGDGSEWASNSTDNSNSSKEELVARLKLLEEISEKAADYKTWKTELETKFSIDSKTATWLNDEDLFRFIRKERNEPVGQKLSDGIGKGIW